MFIYHLLLLQVIFARSIHRLHIRTILYTCILILIILREHRLEIRRCFIKDTLFICSNHHEFTWRWISKPLLWFGLLSLREKVCFYALLRVKHVLRKSTLKQVPVLIGVVKLRKHISCKFICKPWSLTSIWKYTIILDWLSLLIYKLA